MRIHQSTGRLAISLLSLSTVTSAWPNWLPERDSLVARDDSSTNSPQPTKVITTNLNTAGLTTSPTDTSTGSNKGTTSNTINPPTTSMPPSTTTQANHTTFDATNPAGNVVMTKPAVTDGSQLYKIQDWVTFGWNYTNLLATPTAVDVLISCSTASATWTLTANMTYQSQATYLWDTKQFQSDHPERQLPVADYTLLIFDADSSVSATADPGYLAPFNGLTFGLYTPQPSQSLGAYVCATCSGALSDMERRGLGAAVTMAVLTIFSFTWFVAGFAGFAI